MSERLAFIQACLKRTERIVDICDRFGISEKTGHKLLRRFRDEGPAGLADRSHAPHTQPHRMTPEVAVRILAFRRKHPRYGAEKLAIASCSTSHRRPRRRAGPPRARSVYEPIHPRLRWMDASANPTPPT